MTLQIIVADMAGKKFRMGIPEDIAVGRILPQIITKLQLPSTGYIDRPLRYRLIHNGLQLREDETLEAVGVQQGDEIRLVPDLVAGSPIPDFLIIAASVASIVQVILMVVDIWSKKAGKESKSKATEKMQTTALNEVRQIRVLMSDGNWVIFDSWLREPEKVKSFIDLFNLTSASPKPLCVLFDLGYRSQVQLVVSNDPASRQQLEHFIAYLKDGRDADYHAAQVEHITDLCNQFEKDEQEGAR